MRLFVAAELPGDVAARLAAWAPSHAALRPVAPESLHLTLAFLGSRGAEDAAAIGPLLAALARPVPGLTLGGPRWLPPRRPGVLAVDVDDPTGALRALRADLVAALAEAVGFAAERRVYLPHVTVARVRRGAARSGRAAASSLPDLSAAAPPGAGPFAATALTLFESRTSPRGARYLALDRAGL